MTFSKLTSRTVWTQKFTPGRGGQRIVRFIVHHTAGGTNQGNIDLLSTGVRDVSANYVLLTTGELVGIVPEEHRAWTSGSPQADNPSITCETVNTAYGEPWPISEQQFEMLAQMAADFSKRYGWGRLDRVKIIGHREVAATACPGTTIWGRLQWICDRANQILAGEGGTPPKAPNPGGKTVTEVAMEVIRGDWGNGADRKNRLERAGYSYAAVQAEVNRLLGIGGAPAPTPGGKSVTQLANEVLRGDWGNGDDRRKRLTQAGYNYEQVQAEVNRLLGIGSGTPVKPRVEDGGKSIAQLAREVIRGDWGNGEDRRAKLRAAGYDHAAVQAEVNRQLGLATGGKSVAQLATEVIRGDWGNGADRKARLEQAGHNYGQVQAEVNRRLGI